MKFLPRTNIDFHFQNKRNAVRCQPINVAGLTMRRVGFPLKEAGPEDQREASRIRESSWPNLVLLVEGQLLRRNRVSAINAVREWKLDRSNI